MSDKKLHLGHSPLTGKIYLGRQKNENEWSGEKRDVTNEFIQVMLHKFEPNTIQNITIDGKPKYRIAVIDSGRKIEVDGKEI